MTGVLCIIYADRHILSAAYQLICAVSHGNLYIEDTYDIDLMAVACLLRCDAKRGKREAVTYLQTRQSQEADVLHRRETEVIVGWALDVRRGSSAG